jgi:hypothetical protein
MTFQILIANSPTPLSSSAVRSRSRELITRLKFLHTYTGFSPTISCYQIDAQVNQRKGNTPSNVKADCWRSDTPSLKETKGKRNVGLGSPHLSHLEENPHATRDVKMYSKVHSRHLLGLEHTHATSLHRGNPNRLRAER